MTLPEKICSKCKAQRPLEEFHKNSGNHDGLHYWCKECSRKNGKNYRDRLSKRLTIEIPETKVCTRCKTEKMSSQFSKSKRAKEGLHNWCKTCVRDQKLKLSYGIDVEAYDRVLKSQNGVCAICQENSGKRILAVDHDHITGRIRGLLCDRCNVLIGMARDNIQTLRKAILYLYLSKD